jgi:thiol-disulfide isomerase/thioredoxin
LYFWDPECGHCKKVTPKLVKLYNQKLKYRDIEVFAVGKGIGKDFESWKKYIRENNLNFINVAVTNSIYEIAKATPEKLVPVNAGDKGKPTTLESLNFQTTYDLYSTPRIFVLDKDKKIIAKNLSVSQVEDLLDNLQGYRGVEKILKPENVDDESQESLDENLSNAEIQEIESKEKELSEELQSIINSQLKTENYISPNVKLDVNARTENVYIDGKKETKIHLEYLYEVVKFS